MSSPYAEHIQHSGLRLQNGATAQCANLNGGHGYGDLKGAAETI